MCISLAIHLAAVALLPHAADRPALPSPLQVRISLQARPAASPAPTAPVAAPVAAVAPLAATAPLRAREGSSPVVATDAPTSPQAAVAPAPTIDVPAALAAARAIGKTWRAPRETGIAPRPPATVETVIARATRPDALVEERDAVGNWVQRFGRSRCIVAPNNVPHFMRGMVIPAQCEFSKS
ncbi:MAG: hypothetical protein Q8M11_18665 [Sulfuritalea sp.]|nr:hypothetical protein [Sulfuritalea sp.]MDP1985527.1 hypothetical protein [Sulfuritalea sp.]